MLRFSLLILTHYCFGILITLYVWASGAAIAQPLGFFSNDREDDGQSRETHIALAYPFGLLWLFVICTLLDLRGALGGVALLIGLAPLAWTWKERRKVASAVREFWFPMLMGTVPGIVAGGVWHGPSAEIPGRMMFDTAFYVGRLQTVFINGLFGNELSAERVHFYGNFVEQGPTHVGAALSFLPGLDPFMFFSTTAVSFFGASTAICLARVSIPGCSRIASRIFPGLLLGLLMAATTKYPSWLTESPPVAFALPLGFSAVAILNRSSWKIGQLLIYGFAVLACLYLTKALAAPFFAVLLIPHFISVVYRRLGLTAALAGSTLLIALIAVTLFINHGIMSVLGAAFVGGRDDGGLLKMLRQADLFVAVLILAGYALLPRRYRLAASAGGATYWIFPSFINLSPSLLLQLVAVKGIERIRSRVSAALLTSLALGGAALAIIAVKGRMADVLLLASLTIPLALVIVFSRASRTMRTVSLVVAWLAGAGVSLAIARPSGSVFTPAKYTFWKKIGQFVPQDALVFTDQTGLNQISFSEGSNYLPSLSERQLFLSGWSATVKNPSMLQQDFVRNEDVLRGAVEPGSISYSRRYAYYFAAVAAKRNVPLSFKPLYHNTEMALYRISP